jgi:hypothetical protein
MSLPHFPYHYLRSTMLIPRRMNIAPILPLILQEPPMGTDLLTAIRSPSRSCGVANVCFHRRPLSTTSTRYSWPRITSEGSWRHL